MNYYREILNREYAARVIKNPRFSRNAYARFLGISPSYYSKLMNEFISLSVVKANEIAAKLELGPRIRKDFILSVADELKEKALMELDPTLLN